MGVPLGKNLSQSETPFSIEAISKIPNSPISMRPAVLTDSLEEVPTVGRDSSDHLQCLTSNYFSIFEIASCSGG
jgi:hypothetical protein